MMRPLVRHSWRASAILAVALAPACLHAQQPALSLEAARAQALATHPDVAAARAEAEAAVHRARQALLLEAPELEGELGTEGPFTRAEGGVTYTVPLRSSRKTNALRAVLEAEAQRANRVVDAARASTELLVTRSFFRAALLADRLRIDADDSAAVAALAANAERRRALGFATDIDVLRLEAEASAARRRVVSDRGALRAADAALAALLGDSADSLPPLVLDRTSALRDTTSLLLTRRLGEASVAAAELGAARARAALALARLYRWTDPRIGGRYGVQQGEQVISAVVRLPLPARRRNEYAIQAADRELFGAESRLTAARRRADATLREATALRTAAAEQLALLGADLERRRAAELLARRRLEEGGPYLQIWLDIRRDRLALEREELDLILQLTAAAPPLGNAGEDSSLSRLRDSSGGDSSGGAAP